MHALVETVKLTCQWTMASASCSVHRGKVTLSLHHTEEREPALIVPEVLCATRLEAEFGEDADLRERDVCVSGSDMEGMKRGRDGEGGDGYIPMYPYAPLKSPSASLHLPTQNQNQKTTINIEKKT